MEERSMKKLLLLVGIALFPLLGCTKSAKAEQTDKADVEDSVVVDIAVADSPRTIGDIPLPKGYERVTIEDTNSFAYYLRHLPLKPEGTPVRLYDGEISAQNGAAYAVLDIDTGDKDLQQCADAIIRLLAEWLYGQKRYNDIKFHLTNGWLCEYKRWAEGERVSVVNNKTSWYRATNTTDYSYPTFRKYLDFIFNYAGTLSLSKELKQVSHAWDLAVGDVFVKGGSPGHAMIVVDIAYNVERKDRIFLVAESYMPAQDIHILKNTNRYREIISPWHAIDDVFRSGDWYDFGTYTFSYKDLKRFE